MGKSSFPRRLEDHEARAYCNRIRVSPRKLNLVASSIRGLPVNQALGELEFSRKRISGVVRNVLMSAIANAQNNHQLDVDQLVVTEASVGRSLVMKRYRARARGRVGRIQKPFSNLTIVVAEAGEAA